MRGAIVKGKLYHDDQIVFGSALVRAYELESTVVNFPRRFLSRPDLNFGTAGEFRPYRETRDLIQRRLKEAIDNPKHFAKIKWFASYWNECIPEQAKGFPPVTISGLIPKFTLGDQS